MRKKGVMGWVCCLLSLALMSGCSAGAKEKTWAFEFDGGAEGFEPIFADYHDDGSQLASYEMQSDYREIPADGNSMGLYIAASNRSDDLFMGYVKKLDGLQKGRDYVFAVSFQLATSAGSDFAGIGGSPGSSVFVKGGVTAAEPRISLVDTHYRLNISIGSQSEGGEDLLLLGNMEKPALSASADGFALKEMAFTAEVKADGGGCAYLTIGTDSGFEGFTEYYLDNITVKARMK